MTVKAPARKRATGWSEQNMLLDLLCRTYTEEAYLTLSDMGNYPLELSDGRLIVREMPAPAHQAVVFNLGIILREWETQHKAGQVYLSPMPVRLRPDKFREPDVMFYKTEHLDRVQAQFGGVPDLVVEVLSPRTAKDDRGEKMLEYARAGVPEYWIVEPSQRQLQVYVLRRKQYELAETLAADARCRAHTLPELEFAVSRLFAP